MFSNPEKNLEQFGLQSGQKVADLGSGAGFYALAAATIVGDKGKVYAIDILKEMLQKLKNEAVRRHLVNIETLWGNVEKLGGTRLADATADVALVCNTLFQVEKKDDFITEIKRILKPGGKVLLIDWKESFGGMGPHKDHVVSESKARELFEKQGFVFDKDIRAGAHHYGLVMKRG